MKLDIAIINGTIYDGTGATPIKANLGISGDKLVFPLETEEALRADKIIDAEGLAVSPGFINIHGHSDIPFIVDGRSASNLCQGITTEAAGNCGISVAPAYGEYREEMKDELKKENDIDLDWDDLTGFFNRVKKEGISINMLTFIGHGNLRGSVVGMKDRPATTEELQKMKEIAAELMKQGAWGLSTGLIYPPSCYGDIDEISEICKTIAEMGGIYTSHIRSEGTHLLESIEEALEIGRRANIPVEISHLKAAGKPNWGKVGAALEKIKAARKEGIFVQHDQYPYTISATGLSMVMPDWTMDGGNKAFIARLKDPEIHKRITEELKTGLHSNGDTIIISVVNKEENRRYEGRKVDEIARDEGKSPIDFVIDLLIDEEGAVGAIFMSMCEEDVRKVMQDPYTSVCTDAWARAMDGPLHLSNPHPRTYGSFPRVIGHYARELKLFPIEEAIRKMTTLPAQILRLKDRGRIADGFAADLVIFDPENITDKSTIADPHQYAGGIAYVIVNGVPALEKGNITTSRPGRILHSMEHMNTARGKETLEGFTLLK